MLRIVTIVFLLLYVLQSIFGRRNQFYLHCIAIGIIVSSEAYLNLRGDRGTWYILVLGVAMGEASFLVSMIVSKLSLTRALRQLQGAWDVLGYAAHHRVGTVTALMIACREELLWRCSIQSILGNSTLAVAVTATCFTLIHVDPGEETVYVSHYLDLLVFSLILGLLYYSFNNFYLVFAIHFVRNINIMNLNVVLEHRDDRIT